MKNKKSLPSRIRISFLFALLFSIGLPCGIVLIVYFANKNTLLMVLGIVLCVAGFYGSPFWWIGFAGLKGKLAVLYMIDNDNVCDVATISTTLGMNAKNVAENIRWLITSRYLTDVIFDGQRVLHNKPTGEYLLCPYCGTQVRDLNVVKCPNCNGKLEHVSK